MPYFDELWAWAQERPNVYIDLSSPYLNRRCRHDVIAALGPQRSLFGTDGPFGPHGPDGGFDQQAILREIAGLGLSDEARQWILSRGFCQLIGQD